MRSSTPPPSSAPSREGMAYCHAATPALASTRTTTIRRMTRRMSPPSRLQAIEHEVDMGAAQQMRIDAGLVVATKRMLPQRHHQHRSHDREERLVLDRAELPARHAAREDRLDQAPPARDDLVEVETREVGKIARLGDD